LEEGELMPYNPYQYYPQQYQQNNQQMLTTQMSGTQQPQFGGFVSVRNEMEARNYPVAPGNSVMFRDETGPYIYSKSMGYSQLDTPRFDKYRLVKEEDAPVSTCEPHTEVLNDKTDNLPTYALKSEFDALQELVGALAEDVDLLKTKRQPAKKKEVVADE
jgi:hypothetical protein